MMKKNMEYSASYHLFNEACQCSRGGLWIATMITLFVGCSLFFSCSYSAKVDESARLILSVFQPERPPNSPAIPLLIATELTGKIRGSYCVFLQVEHSSSQQFEMKPHKGLSFSKNSPESSEELFTKFQLCETQSRPCLAGEFDRRRTEFVVELNLLSAISGGLLTAKLYKGSCVSDEIFQPKNFVSRSSVAIGTQFDVLTSENSSETVSDGGGG